MKRLTRSQAIRAFCISCSGDNVREVKRCTSKICPLFPFRMGKEDYSLYPDIPKPARRGNPAFFTAKNGQKEATP